MAPIRSFVAIPIPDNIKRSVQDWIEPFRQHDSSIRWVKAEGIHLTLKFLGDVEEERFESERASDLFRASEPGVRGGQRPSPDLNRHFFSEFTQLCTPFRPIRLSAGEVGQFPLRGTPRVLWVGLSGRAGLAGEIDPLRRLAQSVEEFFERFGFPKEKRVFAPHVTIARMKEKPSSGFLKKWHETVPVHFGDFVADRVVFYKSELTKTGSVYRVIREFKLGGSDKY